MTRIQLAIDTSGREGSVAIMRGQSLLYSFPLPKHERSASTMAPRLKDAIQWCQAESLSIDFVSVAYGPGSFTGLRIGVTTAKAYCYATGLPLVAIDSVAAVAASIMSQNPRIPAVIVGVNAYRGQIYAGQFERESLLPSRPGNFLDEQETTPESASQWQTRMTSSAVLESVQWLELLSTIPDTITCAGEVAVFPLEFQSRFEDRMHDDSFGVGTLGHYAALLQHWIDPIQLTPRYLKLSAAEESSASRKE